MILSVVGCVLLIGLLIFFAMGTPSGELRPRRRRKTDDEMDEWMIFYGDE